jgi:transcriptional regulator with XRE-family HTH domain
MTEDGKRPAYPRGKAPPEDRPDLWVQLGARVRWLREHHGLTLDVLAPAVDVSGGGDMSSIERGIRPPTLRQFFELARRLMVSPNFLLMGRATRDDDAEIVARLIQERPDLVEFLPRRIGGAGTPRT